MNYEEVDQLALAAGFTHTAPLDIGTIELKPEVRDMCAQGCSQYDKRWSCPPACGTLEQGRERLAKYSWGILLQTVGELEDEFDGEGMMELQQQHAEHFNALLDALKPAQPDLFPLGTGCCMQCRICTYPDAPCRFPDKMISSMEAYGMLVLEVCKANGLAYYYGENTMAYTACILFK